MMNTKRFAFRFFQYGIACLAAVSLTRSAAADVVSINSVSYIGTGVEFFTDENNLINGSGLSGAVTSEADFLTITHGEASGGTAWVTNDPGGFPSDYFASAGGATIVFDFTLDGLHQNIDRLASWGYHFGGANNGNFASAATLEFSTNGGVTFDSSQNISIGLTAANATISSFIATDADFIRMTITDNHFGSASGGDRVGLAEFRFATAAVPEPSSLSILGIACLGLIARRRTR